MGDFLIRPQVNEVNITDEFWKSYINMFRGKFLPETFDKLEKNHYFDGFKQVINGVKGEHPYQPFSDGVVFEAIRGASDFLYNEYDAKLDARLDKYIELIKGAQDAVGDGFISSTQLVCSLKSVGVKTVATLLFNTTYIIKARLLRRALAII